MRKTLFFGILFILVGALEIGFLAQKPNIIVPRDYCAVDKETPLPWAGAAASGERRPPARETEEPEIAAYELPNLELLATLIGNQEAGKERRACIRNLDSGYHRMYSRGERICSFLIARIEAGEVLLVNDAGVSLTLVTRGAQPAQRSETQDAWFIPLSENKAAVKKELLLKRSNEIIRSAGKVSVYPYARGDIKGLQVVTLPQGSVFSQSGLLPNDVIQSVNNQPVDSYQKALQVARKLPSQKTIEIKLVRNGRPLMLTFVME